MTKTDRPQIESNFSVKAEVGVEVKLLNSSNLQVLRSRNDPSVRVPAQSNLRGMP